MESSEVEAKKDQLENKEVEEDQKDEEKKKKKKKKKNKNKNKEGENEENKDQEGTNKENGQKPQVEEKKAKENEDSEGEDENEEGEESKEGEGKKKKKKKRNKKKKTGYGAVEPRQQDNSRFRLLGSWKAGDWKQTCPPNVPVSMQFPDGNFPVGEIKEYDKDENRKRITQAEYKEKEKLFESDYQYLRKAAECHRQVRKYAQKIIQPGKKLIDICSEIENANRRLSEANKLESGIAFPTGCSINHCAAHYTPNPGDERVLEKDDVCKIDFGTHFRGLLVDCAFTVSFNPVYDELLLAVKEATETGIREAGIDARLNEIGEKIQETMESHEVTIDNKTYQVKPVKNLSGHLIAPYHIHAGKSVPIVKGGTTQKMEEGELYAIETFGSTGKGYVIDDLDTSHYMKDYYASQVPLRNPKAKALLAHIENHYGTLAFCRRWIQDAGFDKHLIPLKSLVDAGIINPYPPLSDVPGSYVAQYEHTILLRPTCKEILTRGDDY